MSDHASFATCDSPSDHSIHTVPSNHPDRTARAVHCIDPRTTTDRQVKIHLEREESKDIHRFSLMALLVRPACPEGCSEVLASVSDPMMDFYLSYFTKAWILELSKDLVHNSTQPGSADHSIVQSVRVNNPTGRVDRPDHVLILTSSTSTTITLTSLHLFHQI
ncbi:hypothetical protein DY000_02030854 [Brassica cretica]|uniref:Uncharacterized protein n=1 Tax=Brassica cretica TaxID=69181 RepID=A0ABQ7DJW9_BRACR|nr:hypothetical protein DY000_02030854 [Brassica cretica]